MKKKKNPFKHPGSLKVIKLKGHEFYQKKKIRVGLIKELKKVRDKINDIPNAKNKITVCKLINLAIVDFLNSKP